MVVRISSGVKPIGAIYYNEDKVSQGEAERLGIRNFMGITRPVEQLNLHTIASRLDDQATRNQTVKKPTFHVSLSLAQGEKPTPATLLDMADRYMKGMGYEKQPYVVYQHHDTDHTHIHIVSVRVDRQGKKIPDSYERERSNKLRQALEKEYGLQVAEKAALRPQRAQLQPVDYGAGNLKKDIAAVVNGVLSQFSFSSFAQFNQLLAIYNVKAIEVPLEGKSPGLVYSAIDAQKIDQGARFKSSSLTAQPTLERVSRRINAGKKIKGDRIARLRDSVRSQLNQCSDWKHFQQRLARVGIATVPHLGQGGNLFGLSFLDISNRTLYSGSELGKAFTAGSLKKQLGLFEQVESLPNLIAQSTPVIKPESSTQTRHQGKSNGAETEQIHQQAGQIDPEKEQQPIHNLELVRQLLQALGQGTDQEQSEQYLKKMIKKSRKIR